MVAHRLVIKHDDIFVFERLFAQFPATRAVSFFAPRVGRHMLASFAYKFDIQLIIGLPAVLSTQNVCVYASEALITRTCQQEKPKKTKIVYFELPNRDNLHSHLADY